MTGPGWNVILGDCLDVLKTLPDGYFDSMVTDPPAGISFFGAKWDSDKGGRDKWICWLTNVMKEAKRTLKPGAFCLVWSLPKTSGWTHRAIEDAGFEIRDVITHHFGTGFPKSKASLKPASEHWILARKRGPMRNLQIDQSRIPGDDITTVVCKAESRSLWIDNDKRFRDFRPHELGRYPANVILSHDVSCIPDGYCQSLCPVSLMGDKSRFFYRGRASTKERMEGTSGKTRHPTVKSIALMTYLINLISPEGSVILDPFAGSGTGGIAAILSGHSWIGIEMDPAFCDLARERITHHNNQPKRT